MNDARKQNKQDFELFVRRLILAFKIGVFIVVLLLIILLITA